ncbi:hypothetical protein ACOSP7_022289 [Xanthoceras sorbifolium]
MGGNFKKAYNKSGKPSKYANTSNVSLDRAWGSRFEALSEDVERLLEEATVSKANGTRVGGKKASLNEVRKWANMKDINNPQKGVYINKEKAENH